jgi:hypothetical protein
MKIGEQTIEEIARLVEGLLLEHLGRLNQGWKNVGEKDFKISLPVSLDCSSAGITPTVKISYTIEVVLFEEKSRPCYLRPGVEVFENVCNKCEHRIDLIFVTGDSFPRIMKKLTDIPTPLGYGQMLQTYVCPAWADEFYKEWCDLMIAKEPEQKEAPKLKKIAGGKR